MYKGYEWATYHAYYSSPERKKNLSGFLHFLMDRFDIHPNRDRQFRRLQSASTPTSSPILVFLHIPKTGGTYVSHCLKNSHIVSLSHSLLRENLTDEHVPVGLIGTRWKPKKNYLMFSTVRNPVTFFRSYYHHVIGHGRYHNKRHYDYQNATKGFDFLLEAILDRDNTWPSRKFLYPQLFDQSGKLLPQWVSRCESLDHDLEIFAKMHKLKYSSGDKKRAAPVDDIEKYYSDNLLDRVNSHYSREMRLFGYADIGESQKTEPDKAENILLHGDISTIKCRYIYTNDELMME